MNQSHNAAHQPKYFADDVLVASTIDGAQVNIQQPPGVSLGVIALKDFRKYADV